ncbi:MAG: hypothetical protein Ct9H300mP11_28890 [Chloroflexota bacterium]|nr:MAG: hypothetical protein Ct9H300mP11_28890 [Chloroflexota bacterium]
MALGPWSRRAESWLGTYIPVDPLKGEILRLKLDGPPIEYDISGAGAAIYPKLTGLNWCGTTEDWKGFDLNLSEDVAKLIQKRVGRVFPALENAELALHTACLRPVTPDWLPVLGQAPGGEKRLSGHWCRQKGNPTLYWDRKGGCRSDDHRRNHTFDSRLFSRAVRHSSRLTNHHLKDHMVRNIRITAGSVVVEAELNNTRTAKEIWDALPIEERISTWGDEIYFRIPGFKAN